MQGVVRFGEEVRNEAISLILNTPKTGRLYWRRGVSKTSGTGRSFSGGHRASAPGEPPASDTGRLVNSITTSYDFNELSGTVRARTEYAAYLEYGTSRMEPRPFMRPAVANVARQGIEGITAEVRAVLR
jgi:HK97 gp10 family phage protein